MRLERLEAGNYICPDDPGEISYPNRPKRRSVTDEEAGILRELARGQHVLEIGTGLGIATRAMAETAKQMITIDPDPWVEDPGLPNVLFLRGRPEDRDVKGAVSLAFVDGSHHYWAVLDDLEWLHSIDTPVVVMHDTYLDDVDQAMTAAGLEPLLTWPTPCWLALCRFR